MTDFVMVIGRDFERVITYKDNLGVAIDLTGYTAKLQARNIPSDSFKILDITPTITPLTGTITISISHTILTEPALNLSKVSNTASLIDGDIKGTGKVVYYDLMLTAPSGKEFNLLDGRICFVPSVTR